jgi:hypothetical protein
MPPRGCPARQTAEHVYAWTLAIWVPPFSRSSRKTKKRPLGLDASAKPRCASFAITAGARIAPHTLSLIRPGEERDESEGYSICNRIVSRRDCADCALYLYTRLTEVSRVHPLRGRLTAIVSGRRLGLNHATLSTETLVKRSISPARHATVDAALRSPHLQNVEDGHTAEQTSWMVGRRTVSFRGQVIRCGHGFVGHGKPTHIYGDVGRPDRHG